jgi:hypothetical protein
MDVVVFTDGVILGMVMVGVILVTDGAILVTDGAILVMDGVILVTDGAITLHIILAITKDPLTEDDMLIILVE